jgi:hypothetical protein
MPKYISVTSATDVVSYINVDEIVLVRQDLVTATKILVNVATTNAAAVLLTHATDTDGTSTKAAIEAAIAQARNPNSKPRVVFPVSLPSSLTSAVSSNDAVVTP